MCEEMGKYSPKEKGIMVLTAVGCPGRLNVFSNLLRRSAFSVWVSALCDVGKQPVGLQGAVKKSEVCSTQRA